jgi:hypothetical protein
MPKIKWWDTTPGALGVLLLSAVGGSIFTYLEPTIGIPLLIVLVLFSLWLIHRAHRIAKQSSIREDDLPFPKEQRMVRNGGIRDFSMITNINDRVFVNHGHIDYEGIEADYRDGMTWNDILKGKCSRCGRPRNESRYTK